MLLEVGGGFQIIKKLDQRNWMEIIDCILLSAKVNRREKVKKRHIESLEHTSTKDIITRNYLA